MDASYFDPLVLFNHLYLSSPAVWTHKKTKTQNLPGIMPRIAFIYIRNCGKDGVINSFAYWVIFVIFLSSVDFFQN